MGGHYVIAGKAVPNHVVSVPSPGASLFVQYSVVPLSLIRVWRLPWVSWALTPPPASSSRWSLRLLNPPLPQSRLDLPTKKLSFASSWRPLNPKKRNRHDLWHQALNVSNKKRSLRITKTRALSMDTWYLCISVTDFQDRISKNGFHQLHYKVFEKIQESALRARKRRGVSAHQNGTDSWPCTRISDGRKVVLGE